MKILSKASHPTLIQWSLNKNINNVVITNHMLSWFLRSHNRWGWQSTKWSWGRTDGKDPYIRRIKVSKYPSLQQFHSIWYFQLWEMFLDKGMNMKLPWTQGQLYQLFAPSPDQESAMNIHEWIPTSNPLPLSKAVTLCHYVIPFLIVLILIKMWKTTWCQIEKQKYKISIKSIFFVQGAGFLLAEVERETTSPG